MQGVKAPGPLVISVKAVMAFVPTTSDGNETTIAHNRVSASSLAEIVTVLAIAVISLFGNTLVIIAVARFRRLRTASNVFVANLAATDGSFGILLCVLPINIVRQRLVCVTLVMLALPDSST